MYKKIKANKTSLNVNSSYIGEMLEHKVQRMLSNKEPISDASPIIYTERKDGVLPEYNPRTDRFEVAVEAMDKVTKSNLAKREERMKAVKGGKSDDKNERKNDGGPEPIQGTDNK